MAQTVCVIVSAADRERLQAIAGDRNQLRKHVERVGVVLASAEREPAQRVAARHFTPMSAAWLNAVEDFFSKMTGQRICRGVFRSIVKLQSAINAHLTEHNTHPKPFVWTKASEAILAKLDRVPVLSECV